MSAKSLKWITPTFQKLLNLQLAKIMEAIDEGNFELAFVASHTLIDSLKPEDRDKLLKDYILPVKAMLERVGNGKLDFYVGGLGASKQQYNILLRNVRPIHKAILTTLHEGGYLEVYQHYEAGREIGT